MSGMVAFSPRADAPEISSVNILHVFSPFEGQFLTGSAAPCCIETTGTVEVLNYIEVALHCSAIKRCRGIEHCIITPLVRIPNHLTM